MLDSKMISINIGNSIAELEIKEELGKGAFGTVSRAEDIRGKSFALKISDCKNVESYYAIAQELHILLELRNVNIARMYAFDFHDKKAVLVMEYCQNGNLNTRLDKMVSQETQVMWMDQLLSALIYLHHNNVVHRDLKPENILLQNETIKITDFGISRYYYALDRESIDPNREYLSEYLEQYMGTFAGTPYWVAPEVFDNKYTELADVFSLGIIFYAIIARQHVVFEGDKYYGSFVNHNGKMIGIGIAMFEQHKQICPEKPFVEHDTQLLDLIFKMLQLEPGDRIPLKEAKEFLQSDVAIKKDLRNDKITKNNLFFKGIFKSLKIPAAVLFFTVFYLGFRAFSKSFKS